MIYKTHIYYLVSFSIQFQVIYRKKIQKYYVQHILQYYLLDDVYLRKFPTGYILNIVTILLFKNQQGFYLRNIIL